nr:MAG TPA: hypothetical protein [Caudoviricetes sp.]
MRRNWRNPSPWACRRRTGISISLSFAFPRSIATR